MTGRGILKHHFWGDYKASIVVAFDTVEHAKQAQQHVLTMFKEAAKPFALQFFGGGAELEAVEALLVSLGADKHKLTSVATSIDHGEPFTVEVVIPDGSVQQALF